MNDSQLVNCRRSLRSLAADVRQIAARVERLVESLEAAELIDREHRRDRSNRPGRLLDRTTFSVHWKNRCCSLGYGLPYRILEHLAQHANHYVTHQDLLDEVWGGPRSPSSVRSAINLLRSRLTEAGLEELAGAIDGTNSGHYALLIPVEPAHARSN